MRFRMVRSLKLFSPAKTIRVGLEISEATTDGVLAVSASCIGAETSEVGECVGLVHVTSNIIC